jgi:sulfur-oxidizing protein SoxA
VNGEIEMIIETAAPDHLEGHLSTIYSGWVFRSDETQAIQSDDFDNPAFIFVDQAMRSSTRRWGRRATAAPPATACRISR